MYIKINLDYNSLEPYIDNKTLMLHYNVIYGSYIDKLNKLLKKNNYKDNYSLNELVDKIDMFPLEDRGEILYNLGGALNHKLYFYEISDKGNNIPNGEILKDINNYVRNDYVIALEIGYLEGCKLQELINNIIKRYSIYKDTEGYMFEVNTPDKVIVNADKKKIEQVIYNLINNAINYTGDDNKVIVNVLVDKNIRVEIKDTGKGIKKEDLPHIWDKYYHSKKEHKRNVIGTGIGLSIVKTILESHNFKYGVESKRNKGTTFYFEICK